MTSGINNPAKSAVLRFVHTPFSVRRNVVKAWRPLPDGLWTTLTSVNDRASAVRRERQAIMGVVLLAGLLLIVFSSVGYRTTADHIVCRYPLLGKSLELTRIPHGESRALAGTDSPTAIGWYIIPGQSLPLVLWTVIPSLAGWLFVRWLWIPRATAGRPTNSAVLTFARHLGSVYLFVYLMIVVGAALMPLLILISPHGTETFRWYLWCFLFGESFFVPAVMWLRLVRNDRSGRVFGPYRYAVLTLYLTLFILIPLMGMISYLD